MTFTKVRKESEIVIISDKRVSFGIFRRKTKTGRQLPLPDCTHGGEYTRSGVLMEESTRRGVHTEWSTHGGEYIRRGVHTEGSIYGVEYTWNEVHTKWGVRYARSRVHTEWDTHGVGSEAYRE